MGAVLYTESSRARFIEEFLKCGRLDVASEVIGCSPVTHYNWLKKYPDYRAAFEEARDQLADLLEGEIVRRGFFGVEKAVTVAGKREVVREFSDQLAMFWMKARNRAVFGDKHDDTLKVEGELSVAAVLRNRRLKRDGQLEAAAPAGLPAAAEDGSDPVLDEVVEGMNQPTE